jgi:hypothetical protein
VFLNDVETAVDLLYYEAVAKTVVRLVRSTKTPVTIGVHGDWGAGKSSVLSMVKGALEPDKKVVCVWFNGWTFEGFEDAKTVVIETIVEELRRAQPTNVKLAEAAKKVLKRVDWLKVAKKTGGLAFTVATGIPTFDQLGSLTDGLRSFLEKPTDTVSREDLEGFAEKAGEYLKEAEGDPSNVPQQISAFRKEFADLLAAAKIEQLIVLVDDLDRCIPETAIATLEAIRLFLFMPGTAFIVGADEAMIEYAVRKHFPDLPHQAGQVPYARNYLEKLIQVPFRIPSLGYAETRIYVTLLLAQAVLGEGSAGFKGLMDLARKELKKPWSSRGLDAAAVAAAVGKNPPAQLAQALQTANHISAILAEGSKGNPRQIKRFLNSIQLRWAVAEEREFADELEGPKLAKVMLAESFAATFYNQLAQLSTESPDGKVAALLELEGATPAAADQSTPPPKWNAGTPPSANTAVTASELDEWRTNAWVKKWAAIEPKLADTDLRPYVFATRDKRSYLGGLAPAGHLDILVEKLLGPRSAVQALASPVANLTGTEPEQLFDALRMAILGAENLATEPAGVHGLVLLVQRQPTLQQRLVDFLAEVPEDKAGSWLAVNFEPAITAASTQTKYAELMQRWSQSTNTKLKVAAEGALKLKRRVR